MVETKPMTVNERRKYLHPMRIRYWQAQGKNAKSALLDEMAAVTKLHRKSLIRLSRGIWRANRGERAVVTPDYLLTHRPGVLTGS